MSRHLRRWGAAWLLLVLFLGSWAGQLAAQLAAGDDLTDFAAATAENWQSEWLQLLIQAVVLLALKHQLFQADAEDQERIESKLDALLAHHDSCPGLDRSHTNAAADTGEAGDDSNRWRYP